MTVLCSPSQSSEERRNGSGKSLRRQRLAIGLSLGGAVMAAAVTAYQMVPIRRLPDILPGPIWDAEKVDAADYACENLQQPDGPMVLANNGSTATDVAAGGKGRAIDNPALPLVTFANAAADLAFCTAMAVKEWQQYRKSCSWCQVASSFRPHPWHP